MKLFANRLFIITLCIALFLTIVPTTWMVMGRTDILRTTVNTIATPFRHLGYTVAQGFNGFGSYFSGVKRMQDEIDALKKENQILRDQLVKDRILQKQNENLQQYISLQNPLSDKNWVEASVVSAKDHLWILNKGSESGLESNMPVIDEKGAVGKIVASGLGWSHVELVTSPSFSLSIKDVESGATGYFTGSLQFSRQNQAIIRDFSETASLHEGDLIISSGYGSVWPEGFLFGSISSVKMDEAARSPMAVIDLAADLSNPGHVLIMVGA